MPKVVIELTTWRSRVLCSGLLVDSVGRAGSLDLRVMNLSPWLSTEIT